MTDKEKVAILEASKKWFREVVVPNHLANTEKLRNYKKFNANPFLLPYLANFLTGQSTAKDIAKALVYPRALGSSITTSFGMTVQTYIGAVLGGLGIATEGFDIEFNDALSGRKIYCQLKAGPQTINHGDIKPIVDHFTSAMRRALQNSLRVMPSDFVVGVLFGEENQINGFYKKIRDDFPVLVGRTFWHHLTGDENFYDELAETFAEAGEDSNASVLLENVINELAESNEIQEMVEKMERSRVKLKKEK